MSVERGGTKVTPGGLGRRESLFSGYGEEDEEDRNEVNGASETPQTLSPK